MLAGHVPVASCAQWRPTGEHSWRMAQNRHRYHFRYSFGQQQHTVWDQQLLCADHLPDALPWTSAKEHMECKWYRQTKTDSRRTRTPANPQRGSDRKGVSYEYGFGQRTQHAAHLAGRSQDWYIQAGWLSWRQTLVQQPDRITSQMCHRQHSSLYLG